jgi:hypothetical protein
MTPTATTVHSGRIISRPRADSSALTRLCCANARGETPCGSISGRLGSMNGRSEAV